MRETSPWTALAHTVGEVPITTIGYIQTQNTQKSSSYFTFFHKINISILHAHVCVHNMRKLGNVTVYITFQLYHSTHRTHLICYDKLPNHFKVVQQWLE